MKKLLFSIGFLLSFTLGQAQIQVLKVVGKKAKIINWVLVRF